MASGNDPVASSSAASMRLPSVWSRATAKRYLNARTSGSAGSFAKATRHLRTSPGGVTSASSRRTPVEPPSSAMATTALVSTPKESSVRMDTGAPVPPPMTTAFGAGVLVQGRRFGSALRRAANAAVAEGSTRKASVLFFMPATFYASFPPPARASSTLSLSRCTSDRARPDADRDGQRSPDSPSTSGNRPWTRPAPPTRCWPPVQPTAMASCCLPSATYPGMTHVQKVVPPLLELDGLLAHAHEVAHRRVEPRQRPQFRIVVGVRQEAHVHDEIGVVGARRA